MRSVRDSISSLCDSLVTVGLKVCSQVLEHVFDRRSVDEHRKWDKDTRRSSQDRIAEALANGIHNPPSEGPEVPPADIRDLDDLPPIDGGFVNDASESTEVRALEISGAVRRDGRQLLVSDPQRLLSGLLALLADKSLWLAVETQMKMADVYEDVVAPVQSALRRAASYDSFLSIYCEAARVYGVSVRGVSAAEIYRGAPVFVARAGTRTALTNSTSSGVVDGLDRYGTNEILRLLGIPPDHPVANRLNLKDAWRIINFRDGLLNRAFDARRPYFFDREVTSKALRSTMESLPEELRSSYLDMAARNVREAVLCPGFELLEVPYFEPWMTRYTRSAPGHVLISFRHADTRAIEKGIELNFTDPDRFHRFYSMVFRLGGPAAVVVGKFPLALPVILAGVLEDLVHLGVDYHLLHKKAEDEIGTYARRIMVAGSTEREQLASARAYVDSLVSRVSDD